MQTPRKTIVAIALALKLALRGCPVHIEQNKVDPYGDAKPGPRRFIPRIFPGSVSHQVARHADSNVLLVPKPRY
jgi:hypothetical protein